MNEEKFLKLRIQLSSRIGSRRFAHTLGVEEEIVRLGEKYLPDDLQRLRIAALFHDITKEWSPAAQIAYCQKNGLPLSEAELSSPRVLHARTGAAVAAREFPAFVDDTILHAISLHTTGGAGMTIFDELLYLSDYIEPTRTYPECLALREYFWGGYEGAADKELHLHRTVRRALWDTVEELRGKNIVVFPATLDALSYFDRIVQDREKN